MGCSTGSVAQAGPTGRWTRQPATISSDRSGHFNDLQALGRRESGQCGVKRQEETGEVPGDGGKSRDFPKKRPRLPSWAASGRSMVWPLLVRGLPGLMAGPTRFSACHWLSVSALGLRWPAASTVQRAVLAQWCLVGEWASSFWGEWASGRVASA